MDTKVSSTRLPKQEPRGAEAYLIGDDIGSLTGTAWMISDGVIPEFNITTYDAMPVLGGSLHDGGSTRTVTRCAAAVDCPRMTTSAPGGARQDRLTNPLTTPTP